MRIFVRDRDFYQKLAAIAIPIALQNLITVGVSMTDTLMLGALGEVQLSGASIANQLFFMLMILNFGLAGGANVMIAQYWGKEDAVQIRKIMSLVYKISMGISSIFALLAIVAPEFVMSIFTPDPLVIEAGAKYLRVIGWVYPFYALGNNSIFMLRAVGTVNISMVVYSVSFAVNVFFNWVFIFGNLGAPRMEIAGAALATAIARMAEFAIIFFYLLKKEKKIRFRLSDFPLFDRKILKDFILVASPILFNELLWSSGSSAIAMIMGRMGREFVSANAINSVIMQFSSVAIMGIGNASAAIIGNTVGRGEYQKAQERARTIMAMSVGVGLLAGALIFALRPYVIQVYNVADLTKEYAYAMMTVQSFLIFFQSLANINMIGTLRGGGDGRFVLVMDVIFMWTIAIPLGYFAGLHFHWPVALVFLALRGDDILKSIFSIGRVLRGNWIHDVTLS